VGWVVFWLNTALFPCFEVAAVVLGGHADNGSQSASAASSLHDSNATYYSEPLDHSSDAPCGYTLISGPPTVGEHEALTSDRSHLEWLAVDAPAALKEIRSALAPGSTFVVEFANKQNLKAILRYLLRKQNWSPFAPEPVEFVKLNFDFHPRTMRQWLNDAGFKVERQRTVSHYRLGLLKRLLPASALAAADGLMQPTGDWWQLTPSVFVKCLAVGGTATEHITRNTDIFRCPACKGELQRDGDTLLCESDHRWGIRDGVYDFKEQLS